MDILKKNKLILDKMVERLLDKETLEVNEIKTIIDSIGIKN